MKLVNPLQKHQNRKIITFLIIAALIATTFNFVPVEATSLKEEVVYVCLHNDGSVDRVYVVNSFLLDEKKEIIDYGNYEYVQNLSNKENIKLEDGVVKVNNNGDQLYYEGFLKDPQLPWNISIKYYLDGQEVAAEQVGGSTGALEIEIKTVRNPLGNKDFYESYALQLSLTLGSTVANNLIADGGTLATVGESKQANYVILPGKEGNLKLTANVKEFEMPAITIAGVQLNMDFDFEEIDMSELKELIDGIVELDDGVQELLDGIFDMKEGVGELDDGTEELSEGAEEIKDGIGDLTEGIEEYKDGIFEYKDGIEELKDGALELADGAKELVGGVEELDDGVGEFKEGIDDLYAGIKKLKKGTIELNDGIVDIASGTRKLKSGAYDLKVGASTAAAGGQGLLDGYSIYFDVILSMVNNQIEGQTGMDINLNKDNYEHVLEGMLFGSAKAAIYASVQQAVLANLGIDDLDSVPEEMRPAILQQIEEQATAVFEAQQGEILAEIMADPMASQLLEILEMLKGYDQLLAGLGEYVGGVSGIADGTQGIYTGIANLNSGINKYKDGMGEYLDGVVEFYENSGELVDGVEELKNGTTELLDGVIELRDGIIEFEDGTIKLHDGIIELYDGIVEIHDGTVELDDGFVEFKDGIVELSDGVKKLLEGTDELYDGVFELKNGTQELREETASLDQDIIDGIEKEIEIMLGGNQPLKSYVSEKNGAIEAVQFVMQTEGITIPEDKNDTIEVEELTIWQRFIKLFKRN